MLKLEVVTLPWFNLRLVRKYRKVFFCITVELSRRSVARDLVFVLQDVNIVAGLESRVMRKRSALVDCYMSTLFENLSPIIIRRNTIHT